MSTRSTRRDAAQKRVDWLNTRIQRLHSEGHPHSIESDEREAIEWLLRREQEAHEGGFFELIQWMREEIQNRISEIRPPQKPRK